MFGRFELLDRIGLGGMAEVWRARVAGVGGFEKILVVKKILPAFAQNKTFIDMLLAEARLCAVLQHTNIVQTYENGEIDGKYYIAMEYVAGPDLFKILSRATQVQLSIPPELCLFVASEVAKGLHYAHNARDHYGRPLHIIHRDVSPSNVIVSEAGEVKVMDFGVARATPGGQQNDQNTRSGVLKGKLGYMSPEQVTGQPFDHRSDIFSLGIILYESLTLKRLFLAKTDLETLVNIRDARIEHKFKKHSYIDEGVRAILRKALARDVGERYPTAMAMHDDIVKYLFESQVQVSTSLLSNYIAQLFDPAQSLQQPLSPSEPPPGTRPQRMIPATPHEVIPASNSMTFSPEDVKKIRDRIAEKNTGEAAAPVPELLLPQPNRTMKTDPGAAHELPDPRAITAPVTAGLQRRPLPGPPANASHTTDIEGQAPLEPSDPGHTQNIPTLAEGEIAVAGSGRGSSGVGFGSIRPEPLSYTVASLSKETPAPTYRLRTGDGQEFGPLAQGNLESMLRSRTASVDDFVSVNDGPFQTIRSVPSLRATVQAAISGPGAPTRQGVLTQWQFVRLVYEMYAERATGCIELRRGDAVKSVYFRRGRTQYIASNQHSELLGPFMVAHGFISQSDVDMAMARARSTGGRLGDLLIGLNLIKPFQLYQVLERQLRAKFIDAFSWDSGTWAVFLGAEPPADIVPLDIDPISVLAEGVREHVSLAAIEPMFADKLDKPFVRARNPLISVSSLRLQPRESKAVALLQASSTPRLAYDECLGNRQQRLALLHVLFLMLQTDLLTFEDDRN